jgi:hypothetical protein
MSKFEKLFLARQYDDIIRMRRGGREPGKEKQPSIDSTLAYEYAETLCAAGRADEALAWCQVMIERSKHPSTHEYLYAGLAMLLRGDVTGAERYWKQAATKRLYTFNAGYEGWFAIFLGKICFGLRDIDVATPIKKLQLTWNMVNYPKPFLISQLILKQQSLEHLEATALEQFRPNDFEVIWRLRLYSSFLEFQDGQISAQTLSRRVSSLAREPVSYVFFDLVLARVFGKLRKVWQK